MTISIDDTGEKPIMTISNKTKVLMKRRGKTIKSLLKYVFDNTEKQNVKEAIIELQPMYQFFIGSKFTTEIK